VTGTLRVFVLAVFLLCTSQCLGAEGQGESVTNLTAQSILNELTAKKSHELTEFMEALRSFDKSSLTDEEIDRIIESLLTIKENDPFQKVAVTKGGAQATSFPNRDVASVCIFEFRFQKIANSLRRLPMDHRVAKIIDGMRHPPKELEYYSIPNFMHELVLAGKDAVPFIVQHAREQRSESVFFVQVLAGTGDPRAIDYIIEVLNTKGSPLLNAKGDSGMQSRQVAARCLAKVNDKRVVPALIGALQDETYQLIDRHSPQVWVLGHKEYNGRYYLIQHAASESLSQRTGKNWGLLFNEDYLTWVSWSRTDNPDTFTPASVRRSDKDVIDLIEHMFHRYMSARPNPWQPQNDLGTEEGIRKLSAGLKDIGPSVVRPIVDEYRARIAETPIWKDELRRWTSDLLLSLAWPEARQASSSLE
jgi:hypothetical protein